MWSKDAVRTRSPEGEKIADLTELLSSEAEQRWALVQAVNEEWDADLRQLAAVLESLAQRQSTEVRRVERFETDMMAWRMAVDERLSVIPRDTEAKEESL